MFEVLVMAGFALPPALLAAGLLLMGMTMPSARYALERWRWVAPATLVLMVPSAFALLFLLVWRGDGDASTWDRGAADLRIVALGAFALAAAAVATQAWVMLRAGGPHGGRVLSVGAGLAGLAMLVLCAALILAWSEGLR